MAAICAACDQPFAAGENFKVSGTEVFHRKCVEGGGVERSRNTRLKLEVVKQRQRAETAVGLAETARKQRDDQAAQLERALQAATELRNQRDDARRELQGFENRHRTDCAIVREQREMIQVRDNNLTRLRNELAQLNVQLNSLARDNTTLRQRGLEQAIELATPQSGAPAATDDRDATEIRFSLLEIDPP